MKFLWPFLCICSSAFAQFNDDFSDGNLNSAPEWEGDTSLFSIVNERLVLDAPHISDSAILFTSSPIATNASWKFDLFLDFNPSSSNFARIYLISSDSFLHKAREAYFVEVGGSHDDVCLYRQDNTQLQKLIDGKDGAVSSNQNEIRVMVEFDTDKKWTLHTDSGITGAYQFEGDYLDNVDFYSSYFGIFYKYTSSRADKFSMDNISVAGSPFKDTVSPRIASHEIIDSLTWRIKFSEAMDPVPLNPGNFTLTKHGLKVISVTSMEENSIVDLSFSSPFPHGEMLQLHLAELRDTAKNSLEAQELHAFFNCPDSIKYRDVIIHEIMPDPEPSKGLPESEYIEIYNRSGRYLDLNDWMLFDDKDTFHFPNVFLSPDSFMLLVSPSNEKDWTSYSHQVMDLPSLNNSGDQLSISNGKLMVDSMAYSEKQIHAEEESGGRSLELIDPEFYCNDEDNWALSTSVHGGSPGKPNTVFDNSLLKKELKIKRVLYIHFDSLSFETEGYPHPSLLSPESLFFNPHLKTSDFKWENNRLGVRLKASPDSSSSIHMWWSEIRDCHLKSYEIKYTFTYPDIPEKKDLHINEILFNPFTGGSDFVELYNSSDHYFDLSNLCLLNVERDSFSIFDPIAKQYSLIAPGEYIAIAEDSLNLALTYPGKQNQNIIESKLPSFPDKKGQVFLYSYEKLLDAFEYSESDHFPFLENTEGVSLERISCKAPTHQSSNWSSASSASGYASPGEVNSQYLNGEDEMFDLHPEIFSPDNDGYNDHLLISYQVQKAGSWGNVKILDRYGMLVRKLVDNVLLDASGKFTWDGLNDHQNLLRPDYYFVVMEIFHSDGTVRTEKASVVIAYK